MDSVSNKQLTGLKKRQQIASANKMIFVWIIVASIAVSFCGVTVQFLFRQAAFNQKVISAKLETQSILGDNLENAEKLKQSVDALLADTNLAKVKANEADTTLKVVLDALPTDDDKSALGASLQQVILPKSGVTASDLTTIVANALDEAGLEGEVSAEGAAANSGALTTPFSFTATGSYDQLKAMLNDLERSIRPMNIEALSFQSADGSVRVNVEGVSYYSPERSVQLGKRTIKP